MKLINYKMIIQYDGSRYKGWQKQHNTADTIQGKLEAVLGKLAGEAVEVQGSGRTDAGVHARGQVANVKLPETIKTTPAEMMSYLNQYLPEDIAVISIEETDGRFHSRLSAVEKTYEYRIHRGEVPNVFERKYMYHIEETLDVEKMRTAAAELLGTHDYTAFCGNRKMKKSAVRIVTAIEITEKRDEITIRVTGNGFLQNMVRILVGTLVEVGKGRKQPGEMRQILEERNRDLAGPTMPAQGLCLMQVKYERRKER